MRKVVGLVMVVAAWLSVVAGAGADPVVERFPTGLTLHGPHRIAPGPDGAMWFAENEHPALGRIAPDGTVTQHPEGLSGIPQLLAAAPDGSLWLTEKDPDDDVATIALAHRTASGVSEVPLTLAPTREVLALAVDGAGRPWIALSTRTSSSMVDPTLARVDADGTLHELRDPDVVSGWFRHVTRAADGTLVYLADGPQAAGARLGRVNAAGTAMSSQAVDLPVNEDLSLVAVGTDLWLARGSRGGLLRVASDGTATVVATPSDADLMTAAPDGTLWYQSFAAGHPRLAHFDPATGTATSVPFVAGDDSIYPYGLATSADGTVWMTLYAADAIGRYVPASSEVPEARTGAPSAVTGSSATLAGTAEAHGAAASAVFEWGATTAYGHEAPAGTVTAAEGEKAFTVDLSGLHAGTTYHYRLVARAGGATALGEDRTFTTDATGALPAPIDDGRVALAADGDVAALARIGRTLYLGGHFHHIGMATGSGALTDAGTGAARPGTAVLAGGDGGVSAVIGDGAGGWYVGGTFTRASGGAHARVARIAADGTVVGAFAAQVEGTSVNALALRGDTLYIGGDFTAVDGVARRSLAAVDATTGALRTGFAPEPSGRVGALAINGAQVVAGGDFAAIGGVVQARLAAVDAVSGAITAWRPQVNNRVNALVVAHGRVVAGGDFTVADGRTGMGVAAWDATTGAVSTWPIAHPQGPVYALAARGDAVLAGGMFNTVADQGNKARSGLVAIDAVSGRATAPVATLTGSCCRAPTPWVKALAVSGSTTYVAGDFTAANGTPRAGAVAVESGGTIGSWNPGGDAKIGALAGGGGTVYVGGGFRMLGATAREGLAAIDLDTGTLAPWNPGASGYVLALLARPGGKLLVGGDLKGVGGVARANLAEVDATTGAVTAGYDPAPDGPVGSLVETGGGDVAIQGSFAEVDGDAHGSVAVLDAAGHARAAFAPAFGGSQQVDGLASFGDGTVYVVGGFTSVDGVARRYAAELSTADGAPTAWDPGVDNWVETVAASEGIVYLGGAFKHAGGVYRSGLAGVRRDGTVTSFDPALTGYTGVGPGVRFLTLTGRTLYLAGSFDHAADTPRAGLAAIDVGTSVAREWAPVPHGDGWAMTALMDDDGTLFVGGNFNGMTDLPSQGLATFGPTAASASARAPLFGPPASGGDATPADPPTTVTTPDPGTSRGETPSGGDAPAPAPAPVAAPAPTGPSAAPTRAASRPGTRPRACRATLSARARGGRRPALVVAYRACASGRLRLTARGAAWSASASITATKGVGATVVVRLKARPRGRVALKLTGGATHLARTVRLA